MPPTSSTFLQRHIGTDSAAQTQMLAALGYARVDDLVTAAIPPAIRVETSETSVIPAAASETDVIAELRRYAERNRVRRSMIGLGYYDTITPAVIKRNVLENPGWYTAYTPYQPEISQGRLEALINFQTMVTDLTGLAVANASMLDEATAVVEAMLLARRSTKRRGNRFLVDADTLPQTKAVLEARASAVGIEVVYATLTDDTDVATLGSDNAFGLFIQYPGSSGAVWSPASVVERAHACDLVVIMGADLLSLTLLVPPGELGADIAVGTTQRFGVPLGFGGPHAGYMAVRKGLERQLPGRLVGVSHDAQGTPAYRLSLQAREQHIRREKATSNICTAQVLLAVMAGMYAVYHGPDGLTGIATGIAHRAREIADGIVAAGFTLAHPYFFDTVRVVAPGRAGEIVQRAGKAGYLFVQVDDDTLQLSVDETTSDGDVRAVTQIFGAEIDVEHEPPQPQLGKSHRRTSAFLTHPVFHSHHSETAMMRYLRSLADKDFGLDRGMIPLGSCTMKLNAATEMEAVSWPEFSRIHPFAPADDVAGYLDLVGDLEAWLAEMTGYDTVSLQPNAGSQGELAGLLAIREYHRSRGDNERTVCLIPASAHGTNAASAVLAGMSVVVVACDENGNVDSADLSQKIAANPDTIAALMITYPSTHGVYEHAVRAITDAVHEAGGQVYIDGANLNALLGYARFGDFGGDVSHLNLHKTFCIPHGGGGPGVGPVAAKAHLAPFLPGHPRAQRLEHIGLGDSGERVSVVHGGAPVSAAPYGSPSILPISWAYVRLMGSRGLKDATGAAVLAANYVAVRLRPHFPILFSGENGLVAHECIVDIRPLTAATGVTVDDVAKRLVDYGFHAPTMSFPVAGTLMVEPTESENLAELDRFIEAMIHIKREADSVLSGEWELESSPLRNAPHTAYSLALAAWDRPYSREVAAYPVSSLRYHKYWPPVGRIDQAFGDRNLVCECPPLSAFDTTSGDDA